MADIATAYVQIVPSARGIGSNLSNTLGAEMPGAGKSAGGILGGSIASTVKRVLAAAGIGEALKKTLTEGAALQQSLGGVETLFKDSASTVMANAQQAYRTAGLSANAYMEQVTSFSASLLQSLGGDTAAAASVADMALQDMSDNANKFGTDMGRISDAYQGFAKQNYTMLDNLKLGYGGTKTEMERLLADATKLTGVKYDINNLSDVYNAIHAIQENLGVTGTTAKEAASTLTGSFAATKGAFSNVLGNLALGEDIGPSLNALAETVSSFLVGNLIPMVWNIITALPGALVTFLQALLPDNMSTLVWTAIANFAAFMSQSFPTILSQGVQMLSSLVTGFLQGIPGFLANAGSMLNSFLQVILQALPSMVASGGELIKNLASGLVANIPSIVAGAVSIIAQLLSTLASHIPDLLAMGLSLIVNLVSGLIAGIPDAINAMTDLITKISRAFGDFDWASLGRNIINGIVSGVKAAGSALYNALKSLASDALAAAKAALGIKSPSRLFRKEIGYRLPEGAALGVKDGLPLMTRAMNELTSATNAAFTSRLRMGAGQPDGKAGFGRQIIINQYIYSQAQTAADLMREARYNAEKAVLLGV